MTVVVRLFAQAREAAGTAAIQVRVAHGDPAGAVWAALPPEVRDAMDPAATRIALNGEWVGPGTPVNEGDELALIPPVSGG